MRRENVSVEVVAMVARSGVQTPTEGSMQLTDAGRTLVHAAEHTFTEQLAALLSDLLDPDQLAGTAATLALLRAELERTDVGAPVG